MSNHYYRTYQENCEELEKLMEQFRPKSDSQDKTSKKGRIQAPKKLRGALAVELLRREIDAQLKKMGKPLKTSGMNVYIAGSDYEYDLLIVKKDAEPFMGLVYRPEEVAALV